MYIGVQRTSLYLVGVYIAVSVFSNTVMRWKIVNYITSSFVGRLFIDRDGLERGNAAGAKGSENVRRGPLLTKQFKGGNIIFEKMAGAPVSQVIIC